MNWFSAAVGAVIMAAVAFSAHTIDMHFVDKAHEKELKEAKKAVTVACESQKTITTKVDDDYKTITDLSHELDAAHRLLDNGQSCIVFTGPSPGVDNGTPDGGRFAGQGFKGYSFIPARHYIDNAAQGEKYRRQLKGCQKYINLNQQTPPK